MSNASSHRVASRHLGSKNQSTVQMNVEFNLDLQGARVVSPMEYQGPAQRDYRYTAVITVSGTATVPKQGPASFNRLVKQHTESFTARLMVTARFGAYGDKSPAQYAEEWTPRNADWHPKYGHTLTLLQSNISPALLGALANYLNTFGMDW